MQKIAVMSVKFTKHYNSVAIFKRTTLAIRQRAAFYYTVGHNRNVQI